MKIHAPFHSILLYWFIFVCGADKGYQNNFNKFWSLSRSTNNENFRTPVVNVSSASILIQPTSYPSTQYVPTRSRDSKISHEFKNYVFKPRAIPLKENKEENESTLYYAKDNTNNKYNSEMLLPGNYLTIAEEKSNRNVSNNAYNPKGQFQPTTIPLIRSQDYKTRSINEDFGSIIEKPEGFLESIASRRSLSDMFAVEDDDDDYDGGDADGEYEVEEDTNTQNLDSSKSKIKHKIKKKVKHAKKLSKYMMPLLLAYKLKYFALIPLLIAGLVLLVGATGMAGFFFALFAAVMGLQKGGY